MPDRPSVAIVDYGLGNIYSVRRACGVAGMDARCTADSEVIAAADAVILPGIGAFGDAMEAIRELKLIDTICRIVSEGKLLFGICLGMQLLMDTSEEFGSHAGLGLIPGSVVKFPAAATDGSRVKVPHVGWTPIVSSDDRWRTRLFDGISQSECMYFVHSYYVRPTRPESMLAESTYGGVRFCSAIGAGNVMGCQFHPERSGPAGLRLYHNLAAMLRAEGRGRN